MAKSLMNSEYQTPIQTLIQGHVRPAMTHISLDTNLAPML